MSDFKNIISDHCVRLYGLCVFITDKENKSYVLNRRFLGRLYMEATWMEETLDSAGARHNDKWFPFREGVSAMKLFSSVAYDGIHVRKGFAHYNLISTENNFVLDMLQVLEDLYQALVNIANYLIKKAKKCGISHDLISIKREEFIDINVDIDSHLEKDRKLRHIDNPGKTLIYLSTEFLSLKSEMLIFNKLHSLKTSDYKEYIPDYISEEKLRLVLVRFHNLQSLYDTYLSESDIEVGDDRLKSLRGHISFIFHMLKSATEFSHYYERHIVPRQDSVFFKSLLPMQVGRFLEITIDFFMYYFECYFKSAIELCHNVIDTYAEIGEKDVPIPEYRGFHVRPSSLVSKIINYYGGCVKMTVNGVEYDPSTPLELFRVNEEINAIKRVKIFQMVHSDEMGNNSLTDLLNILSDRDELVVYDDSFEHIDQLKGENTPEYIKRGFAYLLASGKIDIKMDICVTFKGDLRSLNDIALLAKHGYGEDKYGNNIALPKALSYLKR